MPRFGEGRTSIECSSFETATEAATHQRRRERESGDVERGGDDIDERHGCGDARARGRGRPPDHQRDSEEFLVERVAMADLAVFVKFLAVVGRQHDPGVFEHVASLERGMELRELVIECPYLAVVLRHEVEHVGCRQRQFPVVDPLAERLRIVGGEIELARVLAEHRVVGRRRCVGPVHVEEVEVDEERPISRAVVEPGEKSRDDLRGLAEIFREELEPLLEAEEGFELRIHDECRRRVPGPLQHLSHRHERLAKNVRGDFSLRITGTALEDPVLGRIERREERGDGWLRPVGHAHGLGEDDPLRGERVDGGARGKAVAVAAQVVRSQRIDEDDDDVRPSGRRASTPQDEEGAGHQATYQT